MRQNVTYGLCQEALSLIAMLLYDGHDLRSHLIYKRQPPHFGSIWLRLHLVH